MSGLDHLRALAGGCLPAGDGLLGNTRCTWGGVELLSAEAILAAFVAQPFDLEGVKAVETGQGAALIGPTSALYADLYQGRIGRLWRIGTAAPVEPELAVDVAFDADLRQERGDLYFRAGDHPDLDLEAADQLLGSAREMIDGLRSVGTLRVRGFVVRASGNRTASAALIALFAVSNETTRSASFRYSVVSAGIGYDAHHVIDPPRAAVWTPRL
jgi:hypothetical protein